MNPRSSYSVGFGYGTQVALAVKKKKKNTPANAGDAIGSGLISGSG